MPKPYVEKEYAPKIAISKPIVTFCLKNLSIDNIKRLIYITVCRKIDRNSEDLLTQNNESH